MPCDLSIAQIILTFSIGGVTLRAVIALLKKLLNVAGILAVGLTFLCCLIATAVYLLATGNFTLICLFIIGLSVYSGTQAVYSLTKAKA